jgi:hypothetical protein
MFAHWDAHLYWAEEIDAMLVILPPVLIAVALLWYFAPRIGQD